MTMTAEAAHHLERAKHLVDRVHARGPDVETDADLELTLELIGRSVLRYEAADASAEAKP
jgi:hypothetical protein